MFWLFITKTKNSTCVFPSFIKPIVGMTRIPSRWVRNGAFSTFNLMKRVSKCDWAIDDRWLSTILHLEKYNLLNGIEFAFRKIVFYHNRLSYIFKTFQKFIEEYLLRGCSNLETKIVFILLLITNNKIRKSCENMCLVFQSNKRKQIYCSFQTLSSPLKLDKSINTESHNS